MTLDQEEVFIHRYLKYYAFKLYFSVITYPLADERLLPAIVTKEMLIVYLFRFIFNSHLKCMIFKKYYSNENESIIYFFTHLL